MADETTKFESCQALFCAFVDLIGRVPAQKLFFEKGKFPAGKMIYETYEDFIKAKNVGNPKFNVAVEMKKAYTATYTPEMSLGDCANFLKSSKSWFHSSVIIAVKLISDLHTRTAGGISLAKYTTLGTRGMQRIDYYRGDKDVMGNIEKICRICIANTKALGSVKGIKNMKSVPFKDPNKWSPADIYYASTKAKNEIAAVLKEAQDPNYEPTYYYHLNNMIYDLMVSGDLLGVSLKKQPDPSSVKIELVNFSGAIKKNVLEKLSYSSHTESKSFAAVKRTHKKNGGGSRKIGKKNITWPGGEVPPDNVMKNMPSRDFVVECKIGSSIGGNIQMRHDPSGNSWKVDFKGKGAGARAGSVTSLDIFCDIWHLVDSAAAGDMRTAGKKGMLEFTRQSKLFMNNEKEVQRLQQIPFKTVTTAGKWITKGKSTWFRFKSSAYDFQKGEISSTTFMNAVLPVLTDWFDINSKKHNTKKDAFCRLLFQYVTSRHPLSGKFVIVK